MSSLEAEGPIFMRIAVLGSSHAEHVAEGLKSQLPNSEFDVRPFTVDAATMWKNVSWCGGAAHRGCALGVHNRLPRSPLPWKPAPPTGIHFPIWKFLPGVETYDPHIVVLSTGASDSRPCFWDPLVVDGARLGDHYGQNLKQMVFRLTHNGYYVLLVTPPAFLRGKQSFGDCDSVDKMFGHGDPMHIFNRSRIEQSVIPAQRFLVRSFAGGEPFVGNRASHQPGVCVPPRAQAEQMWNVGLYDLHALTAKQPHSSLYRDCAHLKDSSAAFAFYDQLLAMIGSLREKVFATDSSALCQSKRCSRHNEKVMPLGTKTPEPYEFPHGDGLYGDGAYGADVLYGHHGDNSR